MSRFNSSMPQQIAEEAAAFERQMTGDVPRSATVVQAFLLAGRVVADTWSRGGAGRQP